MPATLKAKILPDRPSDIDEFHGEGHQRSAVALANAVEQLAANDGAIGLEGRWGSGKSTVIALAQKAFSNQSSARHHFFTFDLWLHHPDLLKLAFLEEFIAWSAAKGFLSKTEAESYRERITDREVTTRVENKRELSFHGLLFVLFAPLLPIAYAWLTPLIFSSNSNARTSIISLGPLSLDGPALALIFLAISYGVFLSSMLLGWRREGSLKGAWSAAARVFSRETDHDKIKQTVRERNPTSEEFQTFFRSVLSEVQRKGDRVVFVFDNIDRLPADIVSQVWSETRSIFSMRGRGSQPNHSSVTAIVPYDASYIADAFKEGPATQNGSRAEHLIRKTFDISIRVAPPLSTDWRRFLESKLEEAFPEKVADDDKYRLFKLFDIEHQERQAFPTPRNVISYLNEVVTIWNQWGDQIPLPDIALYVLLRRDIEGRPALLRGTSAIKPRLTRVVGGEQWPRNLAALHFNVEPAHAYQILLGQDIEKLATGQDPDAFSSLAKSSGFPEVFPDIVEARIEQWAADGPDLVAALAHNMSHPDLKGDYLRAAWWRVAGAFDHLGHCETNTAERYTGLARVLEHLSPGAAASRGRQLVNWYGGDLPEQPSFESGENWFRFFSAIFDAIESTAGREVATSFLEQTPLPQGQMFSLGVCAAAAQHRSIDYDKFGRADTVESLANLALELCRTNPTTLVEILRYPPWFASDSFWQELTERASARVQTEHLDSEARRALILTLADIRASDSRTDQSKARTSQLASDGSLVWHAVRANADGDHLTVGRSVWLLMDASDGVYPPHNPGSHPQFGDLNAAFQEFAGMAARLSDEALGDVAYRISQAGVFSDWLRWAIARPEGQHFQLALKATVSGGKLGPLGLKDIVQNFEALRSILGPDLTESFLRQFAGYAEHFQKHFSGRNSLRIAPALLDAVSGRRNGSLSKLTQLVDDYFDSLPETEWEELLKGGNDEAFEHLLARIEHGNYHPPMGSYLQALMKRTMEVLDGNATIEHHRDRWALLYRGLQPHTRDKFARDVLVNLQHVTTTPSSVELFLLTNQQLADDLPLTQQPNVALDHLATTILSAPSDAGLSFIRRRARDFSECRKKSKEEVDGRLVEALLALRQQGEASAAIAAEIAQLLGASMSSGDST